MKTLIAAWLVAAMTVQTPAAAQVPDAPAPQAATAFDRRAGQLVDLLTDKLAYADYIAPSFQAVLPEEQFKAVTANLIAQYGQPLQIVSKTSPDGWQGTVALRFEKGVATIALMVDATGDQRVSTMLMQNFVMADDSFDRVAADIAALPGQTAFLVAQIDGAAIKPVAGANTDAQIAIGSTFKLYILDELAAQIAAGEYRWDSVVPLAQQSFSSLGTNNWPKDTPVTIQSLANWMISVSDNSATDTLIRLLGRERIEARVKAAGHSDPARMEPFLTTVEAFALKGDNFAEQRAAFVAGDEDQQRAVIDGNRDKLVLANVDGASMTGGPRFIDSLEWFASPGDIARAMIDLRARKSEVLMSVLAINNGVGPAAATDWSYLGYKGGSETGVLSMSVLGQRKSDAKWFVVTMSWNNPDAAVSTDTMVGLITRLLAQASTADVSSSTPPPAP